MNALLIVGLSFSGLVALVIYIQIGRWLGYFSYRVWRDHMLYEGRKFRRSYATGESDEDDIWRARYEKPSRAFRLLFPWIARRAVRGSECLGPCLIGWVFDDPAGHAAVYRWSLICLWPLKLAWCSVGHALILAGRMLALVWSAMCEFYVFLFIWPVTPELIRSKKDPIDQAQQPHDLN